MPRQADYSPTHCIIVLSPFIVIHKLKFPIIPGGVAVDARLSTSQSSLQPTDVPPCASASIFLRHCSEVNSVGEVSRVDAAHSHVVVGFPVRVQLLSHIN